MRWIKKRAFTLIEALVSITLVVLALVFVFQTLPRGRQASEFYRDHTEAAYLARNLLEEARATQFSGVKAREGSQKQTGMIDGRPWSRDYTYKLEVQQTDVDRKQIWARVTWNDSGVERRVVVETTLVDLEAEVP